MNKGDFLCGNAALHELCLEVVVHVECAVIVRRREVAEYKLRQLLFFALFPYAIDVVHAGVDLAFLVIWQHTVHKPLIERQFPAVIGDFQHIIHGWLDHAVSHTFGALRKGGDHIPLMLGGLHGYVMVVDRWHGKIQHIGGLNVSHLFEHGDKLGEVVKAGKSCFGAIARAFRR